MPVPSVPGSLVGLIQHGLCCRQEKGSEHRTLPKSSLLRLREVGESKLIEIKTLLGQVLWKPMMMRWKRFYSGNVDSRCLGGILPCTGVFFPLEAL